MRNHYQKNLLDKHTNRLSLRIWLERHWPFKEAEVQSHTLQSMTLITFVETRPGITAFHASPQTG